MTPISSWQSIGVLAVLLFVCHIAAGWLWRSRMHIPGLPRPARFGPLAAAGACAIAFAALTTLLLTGGLIQRIDHHIADLARLLHDDAFLQLCAFITSMGDFSALLAVTVVAAGFLWADSRRRTVAALVLTVAGSQITTYSLKYAIDRSRPPFDTFASALTPAFPSGHATGAVAVYGFIVYALASRTPAAHVRFEITYWGTAFILVLAATRIILGVHYSSDVLGGLLVGSFWLLVGSGLARA